jgi:hypothetical protein
MQMTDIEIAKLEKVPMLRASFGSDPDAFEPEASAASHADESAPIKRFSTGQVTFIVSSRFAVRHIMAAKPT